MAKKIKLIHWRSKLNASCRMAFFKIPYSRLIKQIRVFNYDGHWQYCIYFKSGYWLDSDLTYKKLSQAIKGALSGE